MGDRGTEIITPVDVSGSNPDRDYLLQFQDFPTASLLTARSVILSCYKCLIL